jgi:hypothetical protein
MQAKRVAGVAVAALMVLGPISACDKEDRRDVEEFGENLDRQIDKLDTDGKDD